ncbi:type II secretion system protein GspL [Ningiella sp. W23]|uniref:type II secretion system protein GspL n=1 Tax=Ningiella sp. W23 TaxID=3023715 RepID=UPI003757CF1A
MQQLIFRFPSDSQSSLHWLVYSESAQEIIASGELVNLSELASLKEHANSAEVIALAPCTDVLIASVTLPANANRKVLGAIPFMLEEEVCGDISEQFVALGQRTGSKDGDIQQVAVIEKAKLNLYQQAIKDAGIFCQQIIPDVLALPLSEPSSDSDDESKSDSIGQNAVSALQIGEDIVARIGLNEGLCGEAKWLSPLLLATIKENKQSLRCFSEIDGIDADALRSNDASIASESADEIENESAPNYDFVFDDLPLLLMLKQIKANTLNLCQGEFSVKRAGNPHWEKWKLAAILAGVALTLNLVTKSIELNELKTQRAQVNEQIRASVSQSFPDIRRFNRVRQEIERRMADLERSGGNVGMLAILSQLTNAFANSGVTPQTLRFDATRTELRMQSVADNFEALERFRRDVQTLGFEVDQGAINNQGDKVVGVIVVKG